MTLAVTCSACGTQVRLPDAKEGGQIHCPHCEAAIAVLPEEPVVVEAVEEAVRVGRPAPGERRPCPHCGRAILVAAQKCPHCRAWLEEDEDHDVGGPTYKPCPRCGSRGARRVTWTAWGSFYGPVLFTHVRCPRCGYKYNGKTGRSNLVPAIFFVAIPLLLILAICGGLVAWTAYVARGGLR
jgi:DNA-directed RNA polymerase subunit RPC12/RpoP